jgi:hypothetical protein
MHFFRNRNRPRSSFDIQVGRFHLLEVTVHLVTHRRDASHRRSLRKNKFREACEDGDEWDWYDTNREEINGEFLELLEASVLSRMFGKELEDFHWKKNPSILPQEHDEIDGVASKNKTGGSKRKRKGNSNTAASKKQHKTKKQQKGLAAIGNKNDDDEIDQKPDKDIYFSFGELIQLAYKKQPIRDDRSSRTILFRSNHPNDENKNKSETTSSKTERAPESTTTKTTTKEAGTFHDRKKLSHRLLVWVSKSDASASASEGGDTSVASRPGEGMYRSEMIPISGLFRKPKELMGLSDDEEDD